MARRVSSPSSEAQDTLRALRRAARRALEIGLRTGTPVYVIKNNEIVDLTKQQSQRGRQKRSGKPQLKGSGKPRAKRSS
jgi:hypothetical protein